MLTITPRFMQVAITLFTGTSIIIASSLALTNSVILSTRLSASSARMCSRSREAMASRFSLRHLAPLRRALSLEVRRARVSFTCFCTSSSLTSGTGAGRRPALRLPWLRLPEPALRLPWPPWLRPPWPPPCWLPPCWLPAVRPTFSMSTFSLPVILRRFLRSASLALPALAPGWPGRPAGPFFLGRMLWLRASRSILPTILRAGAGVERSMVKISGSAVAFFSSALVSALGCVVGSAFTSGLDSCLVFSSALGAAFASTAGAVSGLGWLLVFSSALGAGFTSGAGAGAAAGTGAGAGAGFGAGEATGA